MSAFDKAQGKIAQLPSLLSALKLAWTQEKEDWTLLKGKHVKAIRRGAAVQNWGQHGEDGDAFVDFAFLTPTVSRGDLQKHEEKLLTLFGVHRASWQRVGSVARMVLTDSEPPVHPREVVHRAGGGIAADVGFAHHRMPAAERGQP
ncbi:hypothetical protein [Segniliparus rugosus]|uniref:Uncharacterized protein n=1 Tax=Segniliparus rugosus (strain ATCC BAA-974 / DSM 45345 / CCUG 50838 / CIP 108380 / JCM 13579 / CDC 945) TaxID=679197 RepID=U1LMK0_SEGRC|nr:hypothetical protein [Segniliparus rugosus]ERG69176.1 hypothetical protein HMPREF9336_04320 [Segniliparus rugosus ATCC BAA-974]